jgi:tetratricopeptide (TPR) repeat protein
MSRRVDSAIVNFDKAYRLAITYGDEETKDKAIENLSRIHIAYANSYYYNDDTVNARINVNKTLFYDPESARAYLTQGMIYKKQNSFQLMLESLNKAIAFGNKSGDVRTVNGSKKYVKDFYFGKAKDAIDKKSFELAIQNLDTLKTYDDTDPNLYYVYSQAYNALAEWDKAIAAASKGMELSGKSNESKAKFYFEIGTACIGKKDSAAACSAFRNAQYGGYIEKAKYQIDSVLRCR